MANDPANTRFANLAMMPMHQHDDTEHLTYMHAGWAGQFREYGVTPSVLRKVLTFLQTRPAVLHADELINKKDQLQVRRREQLLRRMLPGRRLWRRGWKRPKSFHMESSTALMRPARVWCGGEQR